MNTSQQQVSIAALFPHYADDLGTSHLVLSLCSQMRGAGLDVRLIQAASAPHARRPFTRDAVPPLLKGLAYRLCSYAAISRYAETVFLRSLRPGEVAYVFPGTTLNTYRQVKERGHILVVERINCHTGTARRILDDAYARLGLPPNHGVTEAMVQQEREELELADFVFSPSPLVARSLEENGVPAAKVLPTSYGWDPGRLRGSPPALPPAEGLTVLFVGTLCVRKGVHLLLDAWAGAGVKGRLVFAGEPEQDIATHSAALLSRPDVVRLGYVNPIEGVFRSADVFAFPTLEEGGPLVSYEAMACSLPVLLSPMGAGAVARHERDGFVLDPYDRATWVEALRRLAGDRKLHETMGLSARAQAAEHTWDKVGRRRRELLLAALTKGAPAASAAGPKSPSTKA
jgi:glycosyltransferase involved in cell wall biosynthesis